jgi:hypothetical protein
MSCEQVQRFSRCLRSARGVSGIGDSVLAVGPKLSFPVSYVKYPDRSGKTEIWPEIFDAKRILTIEREALGCKVVYS